MPLVACEHVTKRRRDPGGRELAVLDDVSFELDVGATLGIWGPRRSGKSTLLRLIAGLERPDSGVVRFDGHDVGALSERDHARLVRQMIGLAPSTWQQTRNAHVVDHVALPLLAAGASMREASIAAREALARVGAGAHADTLVSDLSAGERTRIAIARALVRRPRLLLVDEPALTPSPHERDELFALLRTLADDPELTLIVASEDVAAVRVARQVMTLSDGRLRSSQRPGEVVPFPDRRRRRGG